MASQNKANDGKLPAKYQKMFAELTKLYDKKMFKKAIKLANQILEAYPKHGDTIAMKGLVTFFMGNKEEGHKLVKEGLTLSIRSSTCWHVKGLIHRHDGNYNEAIKCYLQALRLDKDNATILRDLSQLQIHMRDTEGFLNSRKKLFNQRPNAPINWFSLAIARHMEGNLSGAIEILNVYEEKLSKFVDSDPFEVGELRLYKNSLYEESNQWQKGYDDILRIKSDCVDFTTWKEKLCLFQRKLKLKEAEDTARELLDQNPENHEYHFALIEAAGIGEWNKRAEVPFRNPQLSYQLPCVPSDQIPRFADLYQELSLKYPKVHAVTHIALRILPHNHEKFSELLYSYLVDNLSKGVPSLFTSLKPLYEDKEKSIVLGKLAYELLETLKNSNKFKETDEKKAPPYAIIWLYNFLAQHEDKIGNPKLAIDMVSRGIEHTPTAIELYITKAKVYKHFGALRLAAHCTEEARKMDLADRYLNTKSTRYLIRAGEVQQAEEIVSLFTKENDLQANNLFDMQCMWYESEMMKTHFKKKNYGRSLRFAYSIKKNFDDFNEDQFDFHSYCIKKMTFKNYISLMRLEDRIYSHRYCQAAFQSIVNTYITLYDTPPEKEEEIVIDEAKLSKKELQKNKKLLKEREEKREELAKQKEENSKLLNTIGFQFKNAKGKEEDSEGKKLVLIKDYMFEASKMVKLMEKYNAEDINTIDASFNVRFRQKKLLLALRAIVKGRKIDEQHPKFFLNSILFFNWCKNNAESVNALNQSIISQFNPYKDKNLRDVIVEYKAKYGDSIQHGRAAAEALLSISKGQADINLAADWLSSSSYKNDSWQEWIQNLSVLTRVSEEKAKKLEEKLSKRFDLCSEFPLRSETGFIDINTSSADD